MAREIMYDKWPSLTTSDNPYDQNKEFEKWLDYDEMHGYHTLSFIDRLTGVLPDKLSDKANLDYVETVLNDAVATNPLALVTGGKVCWKKCYID